MEQSPLKICHVLWDGGVGGIESLCLTLCNEMSQANSVEIVFGKKRSEMVLPEWIPHTEFNLKSGLDFSPSKYNRAKSHFDKYDIVHLHVYNPLLIKAAIDSKASAVYTIHSLTHLRRNKSVKDIANDFILNTLIKKIDKVTTVSVFAKKELESVLPSQIEISVVPNCVSEQISTSAKAESTSYWNVLSYGRLTKNKRFDLLLELVSSLGKDNVEVNCKIFGEGPQENSLKEKIKELGLENRVQILPFTNHISEELSKTNFCVFPFNKESFGLSLLEAITVGIPSFCLDDGGGMVETLSGLENTFVALDVNSLKEKILKYIQSDDAEKKSLSDELKKKAEKYKASIISNIYISLYHQVNGSA